VRVIGRLYDAMRAGDVDTILSMMTEDVTFVVPGPQDIGAAGTWRGHAGVRDCLARLRQVQATETLDVREFVAQGDTVVVLLHVVARVHATGRTFESDLVHFFRLSGGRVATLLDFFDTAALVTAVRG
jgi:ketosteroid isomerase-like protein